MKKWVAVFMVFFSSHAAAFDDSWSVSDSQREVNYMAVHFMDWLQTRYIVTDKRFYETNLLLGENPSLTKVNLYFLATGILHYVVAKQSSKQYRKWFQYISINIEAGYINNNRNLGIGVKF